MMEITVERNGRNVLVIINTRDVERRLSVIGEKRTQGEFYKAFGVEERTEWHPADTEFDSSCTGWEAFIKEMIDAQHTTKEKANAAAMNLLRILDAWVAGIESSAITYEFTATWPEGKNATEEE